MNPLTFYLLSEAFWSSILGLAAVVFGIWLIWRALGSGSVVTYVVAIVLLIAAGFLLQSCALWEGLRQSSGHYHRDDSKPEASQ